MEKKSTPGDSGNKSRKMSSKALRALLIAEIAAAALVVFVICAAGKMFSRSTEDLKKRYFAQCETALRSWLAEKESDATWDGTLSLITCDSKTAMAAEGTFLRGDKNISFLCVPNGRYITDGPRVYVSALRKEQESAIFDVLCRDFPLSHHAERLYAGHAILIPAEYALSGGSLVAVTDFDLEETDPRRMEYRFERRLLPDCLNAEMLDRQVTQVLTVDSDTETRVLENEFLRYERRNYLASGWRENLGAEITLPEDSPSEHVKELLGWMRDARIREAVFRGKNAETLTITKANILKIDGATDASEQVWAEHWTVTSGDSSAAATAEKQKHYDATLRRIEARMDEDGRCKAYYTESGEELDSYGFPSAN